MARRLERIERRVLPASESLSVTIHFVAPGKGVTSTLLMESGKRVWTRFEAAPDLTPIPRNAPNDQ
jgi:hypothetical protein